MFIFASGTENADKICLYLLTEKNAYKICSYLLIEKFAYQNVLIEEFACIKPRKQVFMAEMFLTRKSVASRPRWN